MPSVPPRQLPNCERAPGDMALSGLAVPATLARSLSSLCSPASGASRRAGPAVFVAAAVDLLTRVRAAALGHYRAPLNGAACPRGPHADPASGARQRRRLPPPGVRARDRAAALLARHRRREKRERGEGEKLARVLGGRPAGGFCSARARCEPSDRIRRRAAAGRPKGLAGRRGSATSPAQAQVFGPGAQVGRRCG